MERTVQSNQLTRLDKNISHNALDLKIFGEEENLISNIIFYIAYSYQTDLFGFGSFDPKEFGKIMGYSKSHLFSKVSEPLKLKSLSKKEVDRIKSSDKPQDYAWDCILDNALYRLSIQNIPLSYGGEAFDGMKMAAISSVQVLEAVEVYFDPSNRNKKYYQYKPTDKFINNLSKRFVMLDRNVFKALSRSNLQRLYMYLTDLRNSMILKPGVPCTPAFDMLCNLANVNSAEDKDKKKYLTKKINKVLGLATHLKGTLVWQGKGKFKYQPVLNFVYTEEERSGKEVLDQSFKHEVKRELLKHFDAIHADRSWSTRSEKEAEILTWLKATSLNRREKALAYLNAQVKVFGKADDINDPKVNRWVSSLANVSNFS